MIGIVLIIGSVTGGLVAFYIGHTASFLINGFTFMIAAVIISRLPETQEYKKGLVSKDEQNLHWMRSLEEIVWWVIAIQLTLPITDGVVNILISYYGAVTFNLGDLGVGLLYGSLGAGLVISFWVTRSLKSKFMLIALLTIFVEGLMHILASQASSILIAMMAFILISLAGGVTNACLDILIMMHTKVDHQGKVFGCLDSLVNINMGLFMLVTGWLIDHFDARWVGAGGGVVQLMLAGIFLLCFAVIRIKKQAQNT